MDTSKNELHIIVKSRDRTLFDGQATAITSVNERGTFDVLAQHSNFVSLIKDYVVVHMVDKSEQKFPVVSGVLKVSENTVHIYIGIVHQTVGSPDSMAS